jgi:hypothetical protein
MSRFTSWVDYVRWANSEANIELIVNEFDSLDLDLKQTVIRRLGNSNEKILKLLTYKKYSELYDQAIKSSALLT